MNWYSRAGMQHQPFGIRFFATILLVFIVFGVVTFPHVGSSGETTDSFRMQQIGRALIGYARAHEGALPPVYSTDGNGNVMLSWRVLILPYLNQGKGKGLYNRIALNEPWNSKHNKALAKLMPDVYRSRFSPRDTETPFLAVAGAGSVWRDDGSIQLETAIQNRAKLFARFESHQVPWMAPVDITADALYQEILSSDTIITSKDYIMCSIAGRPNEPERLYLIDRKAVADRVRLELRALNPPTSTDELGR